MEQSPSWEADCFSASEETPAFYGTQRFITTFPSARQLSLSWARSINTNILHFLTNNFSNYLILNIYILTL